MEYVFDFNSERCIACGACAVACMDQNDTDLEAGEKPFRAVGTIEKGGKTLYLSVGCLHCQDAPCIKACPVGCLRKDEMGLTVYDPSLCVGCRSCLAACPYAAPTFGPSGKMSKCDGCQVRLQNGLQPACVKVCPTKALTCRPKEQP